MEKLSPIMLAGTGSDVGKSLIATGLCRIFMQDGYHPAPFKAQNMALNSYVTPEGYEIGRAQAVQAEAAGIRCHTDMNPILLKPSGQNTSQVVVNGRPVGNRDACEYFRKEGRDELRKVVRDAFDRLSADYNPIVMEGAGSIAEINLRESDIVNMSMARYADADVILVADIDRGGVFASAYGSIMLQDESDRRRIKGIIVNKFRGDMRLFESGRRMMEEICGVPVLGVVPFASHIHVEEEDSVALAAKCSSVADGKVNVAVVLVPHISNFTDFQALALQEGVTCRYADTVSAIVGICGGYQMMGLEVCDPDGVEGDITLQPGLGLLPVRTVLTDSKVTRQVKFRFLDRSECCSGYEIHMGRTTLADGASPLNVIEGGLLDGCQADERCFGSYIHGILDNRVVVDYLLRPYVDKAETVAVDYAAYKEQQYDALAAWLREYLDIPLLYKIMSRK